MTLVLLKAWPRQRPVASGQRADATGQQGQRGPPQIAQFARELQRLLFKLRSARRVHVVKHEREMDQRIGADTLVAQIARQGQGFFKRLACHLLIALEPRHMPEGGQRARTLVRNGVCVE